MPSFLTYFSWPLLLSILHLLNINTPLFIVLENFEIAYNNQPTIFEVTDSKDFAVYETKTWQKFYKIANTIQISIENNKHYLSISRIS